MPAIGQLTIHPPDFLAEIVSRTSDAAPKRTRRADRLVWLAFLGDAVVVALAAIAAFWVRFHSPFASGAGDAVSWQRYASFIALGNASLLVSVASLGVYDRHLLLHYSQTAQRMCRAWSYWIGGVLICTTLIDFEPAISRLFLGLFGAGTGGALVLWRWGFYRLCRRERIACSLRERVLLVGWNPDAQRLAATMRSAKGDSYELVGWLPTRSARTSAEPTDVPCLGAYSELTSILRYSRIDVVILTEHEAARQDILDVIGTCEREMVQFELVPSFFRILLTGLHLHSFGGVPLLGVSKLPLNRLENRVFKRAMDLVGGAIGMVIATPLIAIFGALVYLESPGPIFYYQRRLGRKGRVFDIIKIRSMRLDAEKDGKVGWSTKVDPRRLRIGSFMRKYNIDELPQFWNVLKGEISLVGPRPERPELIAGFKHEIPHYNARHSVKPGITGWAQVNGLRGDTDLAERIRHDIFYMENWSPGFDLKIMFLTLFKHTNAC